MLSYEDIYEFLRAEKLSTDLQPLRKEDLKKISDYLKMKENLLLGQEESISLLSAQKRAKIQIELDNARRTLKDLYEKRERKVINRAVVTARSGMGLKDTTNMLKHEQELYESIISLLNSGKAEFFDYLINLGREDRDPLKELHSLKELSGKAELETSKAAAEESEEQKPIEMLQVVFLDNVQEFYGEDLKSYGPYEKGATDAIPSKIANLLISQKKAKVIQNEISQANKHVLSTLQDEDSTQSQSDEE